MKAIHFLIIALFPILCQAQTVKRYKQFSDKVDIALSDGTLSINSLTDNAVRVRFYKESKAELPELVFTSKVTAPDLKVVDSPLALNIRVKNLVVTVDKQTGKLSFADNSGKVFLNEATGSRKLTPGTVMGEPCFTAEQSFESPSDEFIFGLGQFQDGLYNLKGVTRRLTQVNTQIAIPFIYSSKGYGLLWHQYGLTDYNPADNFIKLEKQEKNTGQDQMMEITTTLGTQKVSQNQSLYNGNFSVPEDGEYSIFLDMVGMGNRQYVAIDGKPCIDQSNLWLPPTVGTLVALKSGEHHVQVVCKSGNTPNLSWKLKDNSITFRSPNANQLDYVVFYGPTADSVIKSYRSLSGNVPMLPLWAYGFWQCRERYSSGKQLVETVKEFRKRNIPMDVIVQDWQYWGNQGWGVPIFDTINYPDPDNFIKQIHDFNARFCVVVWENPDKKSEIGKDYQAKNLYIPESEWIDIFNPKTQEIHWNAMNKNLFSHGVDSWWMDSCEPQDDALHEKKTYLGLGDFYRLVYPLYVNQTVYNGQRQVTEKKRVCILTRSAFAGQQRYGSINWSGDIGGNWDSYKRQIVAGLNYTITGLPYWTTDIGGFFRPGKSQYTDQKYQELLTRWFQWGTLNPIFRLHGYQSETEPWKYGQTVETNMRKMLDLRYRLIPYIYSEAWQITKNGSTMMRGMIMDFNGDTAAVNRQYQYMFGKALLVAPVTEPGITEWNIYLPKSSAWYNFWTGQRFTGGKSIKTDAPIDIIPLFVKAGSIIPLGKLMQYTGETPADNLEVRVYEGDNGTFTLYEDEGDNYNYEKGAYATITFSWNDAKKVLTISDREGSFPGMLAQRKFNIIKVAKSKAAGIETVVKYDNVVTYNGKKVVVKL